MNFQTATCGHEAISRQIAQLIRLRRKRDGLKPATTWRFAPEQACADVQHRALLVGQETRFRVAEHVGSLFKVVPP